jgi:16S rRNA (guanine527-N7)-methyltransferase
MTAEEFRQQTRVGTDVMARLTVYAALLHKWQARINLVGASTLPDLWRRHMLDSAQLYVLAPAGARRWIDLGSGAGFPGLVLAAMGALDVTLVESDTRKATFLREAARAMGLAVTIEARRIDSVALAPADVITARALAPLGQLLGFAARFKREGTVCLFPKGQDVEKELTEATKSWKIVYRLVPSITDAAARIVITEAFHHGTESPRIPAH